MTKRMVVMVMPMSVSLRAFGARSVRRCCSVTALGIHLSCVVFGLSRSLDSPRSRRNGMGSRRVDGRSPETAAVRNSFPPRRRDIHRWSGAAVRRRPRGSWSQSTADAATDSGEHPTEFALDPGFAAGSAELALRALNGLWQRRITAASTATFRLNRQQTPGRLLRVGLRLHTRLRAGVFDVLVGAVRGPRI